MRHSGTTRWPWRRLLADLLIVAGLCFLLYFPATWAYTWWQQRALADELVQAHPSLVHEVVDKNLVDLDDIVETQAEKDAMRAAAAEAQRVKELEDFQTAAAAFHATLTPESGGAPIGRIIIPAIGVDVVMVEGTGKSDLREGPGHWPETPFPGMRGNFVVSGHRTTYGAPFFKLDKLAAGDVIDAVLPYAVVRYKVTDVLIVGIHDTGVVGQRGAEEISLATCHPIYSAAQRLVVKGELVGFKLVEATPASAAPATTTG